MRATRTSQGGFTIVEMIVTLAVMIILAGVVLPAASPHTERKLDLLELQLQDAIGHAQSLAYHTGLKTGVVLDVSGNWLAVVDAEGEPVEDPLTRRPYVVDMDAPDQPGDIHIDYAAFGEEERPLVLFDSKGLLVYPGEIRIRAGGIERWYAVETATGHMQEIPIGG